MSLICTILARGGSRGVPGKNIRLLAGRPLLEHTVVQARATGLFDCIAVSSDSVEILDVARHCGVDHMIERPAALASESAAKVPAIVHCVQAVEEVVGDLFEVIVDLDPTSPLRTPDDVVAAVHHLRATGAGNLVTAAVARKSPYFNLLERGENGAPRLAKPPRVDIARRQDAPECFDMNASIYIWTRAALLGREGLFHEDTALYVMPEERSWDIDSELDFDFVEFLMERRKESQ